LEALEHCRDHHVERLTFATGHLKSNIAIFLFLLVMTTWDCGAMVISFHPHINENK
jgi:hypothetical protein